MYILILNNNYLGYSALINKCLKLGQIYKQLQYHYRDMMTVPQVWQLRQITDCCPGIGPQGEGVQKVVTGVKGTHMKEVVEGGRKKVSVCIGRRGVEEA